jgi:arsenite methyltransferase
MTPQTNTCTATARPAGGTDAPGKSVLQGGVALALSLLACYGTLAAVAVLSFFGVVLAPDDTLWRVAIVAPAVLVVLVLARGARRHARWQPVALALAGTTLLAVLVFWHMNRALELLAFAMLLAAVLAERRLCTRPRTADRLVHDGE